MRRCNGAVFAAYATLSVAVFGRGVVLHPASTVVGRHGSDQGVFIWSLGWWPHAITSGINPLYTDLVYAPDGWNLAWTTVIGGPAILLWPVTALAGPTVSFNVLALLAPALSAFCTYLLCRELVGRTVPAVAGGAVFGFGTYLASQTVNHVNLALVFCIPLAAYLCTRHCTGSIRDRRFVATLAAVLVLQFLTFLEVFLTLSAFALVAFAIAVVAVSDRRALARTFALAALAWVAALVVCSPYLYQALAHPNPLAGGVRGDAYPLDVANLYTATNVTAWRPFTDQAAAARLAGNLTEQTGYFGVVALALLVLAPVLLYRSRLVVGSAIFAAAVIVVSFGVRLTINGHPRGRLPAAWLLERSLVEHALPVRMTVFAWLALAVVAAAVLVRAPRPVGLLVFAGLAVTLTPSLERSHWTTPLHVPAFFEHGRWQQYLQRGDSVLVVPIAFQDNAMLWQQRSGFGYRMTGGYVSATIPAAIRRFPLILAMYGAPLPLDADADLRRLIRERQVDAIVLRDGVPGSWRQLFDRIGPGVSIGGVRVWRVPAYLRRLA